jgi:Na+-translocating ferredoxin:NAD+ oxidoreductase subunit B
MSDTVYERLAKVLNTLPNGFPATESGVEIKLLNRIFLPEEADLFCDMRLTFETAEEVSKRTGRPLAGLEDQLAAMAERGQLFMINLGPARFFRMLPWIFGIFEFQLGRMDKAFAELAETYNPVFGRQFFAVKPQLMQTLAVEEAISSCQEALPYERVSAIIENGQSFLANDCICKVERGLLGDPCKKPVQVCLAVAPIPGVFDDSPRGRVLTREEAYTLLKETEEAGLVHLTNNVQVGQIFICNCCGCCCGVLRAINDLGIPASQAINSHYYAVIDPGLCIGCGICAEERCQVKAIEAEEGIYQVIPERCIGCGLCISACPAEAVRLVHKEHKDIVTPPFTEDDWFTERGRQRGVDFSAYK